MDIQVTPTYSNVQKKEAQIEECVIEDTISSPLFHIQVSSHPHTHAERIPEPETYRDNVDRPTKECSKFRKSGLCVIWMLTERARAGQNPVPGWISGTTNDRRKSGWFLWENHTDICLVLEKKARVVCLKSGRVIEQTGCCLPTASGIGMGFWGKGRGGFGEKWGNENGCLNYSSDLDK